MNKEITYKEIASLFAHYGSNPCVYQDITNSSLNFISDLGGRIIMASYLKNKFLLMGFKNGKLFMTKKPKRHSRKIFNDFIEEIKLWRNDHKGICKKVEGEYGE